MKKIDISFSPLLIGPFSKLSGISCRMLRFYAEQKILVPAFTNTLTGYRRYLASQLTEAKKLRRLRRAEFSPLEIASILNGVQPGEWKELVSAQRKKVLQKICALEEALRELSLMEKDFEQEEFTLASFSPMRVRSTIFAGDRFTLRDTAHTEAARLFEDFNEEASILCSYDLNKGPETSTLYIPAEDPKCETLPGYTAAVTLHRGPYETLPATLERLLAWIKSEHRTPDGRVWERYFPYGEQALPHSRVELAISLIE